MLNLHALETFVICVESGSFSAAARRLNKAQSAVSTTIANLEIDLDITIFDRSRRLPKLTEQGSRLYHQALHLLAHAQDVERMIHAFHTGIEESLTIAINPLLLTSRFYDMLDSFYRQFQHTQLHLELADSEEIPKSIADGRVNFGLVLWGASPSQEVDLGTIGHIDFSISVAKNHPLTQQPEPAFEALKSYRQVMLYGVHAQYQHQLAPQVTTCNDLNVLAKLISLNSHWGFLPNHVIEQHQSLVGLKLVGEEQVWQTQVDRVTPKHQRRGPALDWLYHQSSQLYR